MKNLMKLLIVVMVFTLTTETYAQKFGVKAGLNLANMLEKDDEETYSDDYKMNPGYLVGVTAEFPMTEMVSFETGLLLSSKGFKASGNESFEGVAVDYEVKTNLLYLDIPLTAKAYFGSGDTRFYGVFGPYIGIGLSGKYKYEGSAMGQSVSDEVDIEWGSDEEEDDAKRLDYGLTIGAGVEISSLQIGLSYGLGLANISPSSDGGYKSNNRVLGLSVAYMFGE